MQNQMQVFEHQDFGELGVIAIGDKPHFPAVECAGVLGYKRPHDAVSRHCAYSVKHGVVTQTTNQHGATSNQIVEKIFIPEGDLYRLIIRSKLPTAERFERWVFDEVLPSIRKYGAYIDEDALRRMREDSAYCEELLETLTAERKRNKNLLGKVEQLAPKAVYHDIILQCSNAVQVSIIAKDYGMSAVAFNKLLHRYRVQFRIGGTWLLYQDYQGNGYTVTNTYTKNGLTTLIHTCWTQKGRFWLYELLKSHGIVPMAERMAANRQMTFDDMAV